ncbi:MAG TPA: exo-alpha-sialidase, partial [Gemmatimonadales bacterium]|nr:exo-alpha-sialidase [Gemmatimonadales bacterium]
MMLLHVRRHSLRHSYGWLAVVCLGAYSCGSGIEVTSREVPSAGGSQSADPALAIDPASGDVVMSWIEGDGRTWTLYAARSLKSGDWSAPVRVAGGEDQPEEVHPHGESSPRLIAGARNHLALVWPNNIKVEGRKWPATMMRFSRSDDGGLTWSTPITLNDDTTGALVSHQFHGATLVGDSGLAVAWLDERAVVAPVAAGADGHAEHAAEPDAQIYLTTSNDFGRRWGPNRKGWDAACPCCRVSLAQSSEGQAVAGWRKHFPGNVRDVVTAAISERPGEPERVHPDDWAYEGCPHSGPAIATGADTSTHVVWYNGKQGAAGVYYARPGGGTSTVPAVPLIQGQALGVAHPAVVALPAGGALAAYDVSHDGKRLIRLAQLLPSGKVRAEQQ